MTPQQLLSAFVAWTLLAAQMPAQVTVSAPAVDRPTGPVIVRPYKQAIVRPVQLKNSSRLASLIRAGKLYVTVQDAIALAIENNLDLEINRYGPLVAEWTLERRQAGGVLPGVTAGNSFVNQATSGQGVQGSQVAAGLANNNNNSGGSGGNAVIAQIGPVTQVLDTVVQNTSLYEHITTPQPNLTQSQTTALVDTHHIYNTFVQQGLLSGGYVQLAANISDLKQNAPTDILNPSVVPIVDFYLRHNLLNGFGSNVNRRQITVAEKNIGAAQLTFHSQLLNLVASVLNLYWDLVTDNDDLKARQTNLELAQKFYHDTKREIELEATAKVEIYRAEAELATRKQELAIALSAVRQQENLLKNVISRNGLEDPLIDTAEIVPLDHIVVPPQDDLPPLRELVKIALAKRPDMANANLSMEVAEISALGTANGILPTLQGIATTFNSGLAGTATPQPGGITADPYYVGGLGTAFGQVFRRNFPSQQAGFRFQGNTGNRIHQGDYGIEQLQLRQSQLVTRRTMNQLVVDISNQVIALRQARSRHSAAVNTRVLQEQLLEKEQRKFTLGGSTRNEVIAVQRSLATARSAEVAALANYSHARVALDQVVGETLEKNHVSVAAALKGGVSPATAP